MNKREYMRRLRMEKQRLRDLLNHEHADVLCPQDRQMVQNWLEGNKLLNFYQRERMHQFWSLIVMAEEAAVESKREEERMNAKQEESA